jgi:hypothetical protein
MVVRLGKVVDGEGVAARVRDCIAAAATIAKAEIAA